jgi:predicted amidohydrolase
MSTFGAVVGARSDPGRDEFVKYHNAAIEIPSPAITRMEAISRDMNIFIVCGVIERDKGTLYCTVVFVAPEGYVAKHRKLMPTGTERLIWGQGKSITSLRTTKTSIIDDVLTGDGTTVPVLSRTFGGPDAAPVKISAAICW